MRTITNLPENALFMLDHDELGIWYFTNLSLAADVLGTSYSVLLYTFNKKKDRKWNGWTISLVEDCGDIPFKWINPKNILDR